MTADDFARLKTQLRTHEGLRLKPYRDSVGKLTIGVGRNLSDVGITEAEALDLLDHDIAVAIGALTVRLPWTITLDSIRQRVLIDLAFNMGIDRLLGFHQMLAALKAGDYDTAATALVHSNYATQVGRRATTLAAMLRLGQEVL